MDHGFAAVDALLIARAGATRIRSAGVDAASDASAKAEA
jgi:hypothetical protein